MSLRLLSPVPGRVVPLAEVPDQVFAQGLVGPGLAIDPAGAEEVTACAPTEGRLVKVHPHAFVLLVGTRGVLVHLGIDTVELGGAGFTLHVAEGEQVISGAAIITFSPAAVSDGGRSPVCPVIALDGVPGQVTRLAGAQVATGDPLIEWA